MGLVPSVRMSLVRSGVCLPAHRDSEAAGPIPDHAIHEVPAHWAGDLTLSRGGHHMIGDMREAWAWVRADFEYNAVVVETLDGEAELILSPEATVDLLLKMAGALDRLHRAEQADIDLWWERTLARLAAD
jgi:hypothetical protein